MMMLLGHMMMAGDASFTPSVPGLALPSQNNKGKENYADSDVLHIGVDVCQVVRNDDD
jgi:hypothetical protein